MTLRLTSLCLTLITIAPLAACQRDHSDLGERLDSIDKRLDGIEQALKSGKGMPAGQQRPPRARPKPEVTYSIPVSGTPLRGPKDALVTVVEGFDFACPYCEQSRPVIEQVLQAYPKDVRVAYKNYVVHPQVATNAALAACAAAKQGKYKEMNEAIWDKGFKANRNLAVDNLEKLAGEIGIDSTRFKADMNGAACKQSLRDDQTQLSAVGVSGTPAFYVNGRWVQQRSIEGFKALIDEELTKAKQRVAQGTKADRYYDEWVVEKGEKKL